MDKAFGISSSFGRNNVISSVYKEILTTASIFTSFTALQFLIALIPLQSFILMANGPTEGQKLEGKSGSCRQSDILTEIGVRSVVVECLRTRNSGRVQDYLSRSVLLVDNLSIYSLPHTYTTPGVYRITAFILLFSNSPHSTPLLLLFN